MCFQGRASFDLGFIDWFIGVFIGLAWCLDYGGVTEV